MITGPLAIHGELTVATFGQVLWLRVQGATNLEFTAMMEQRVIEVTTPICDRPWVGVNDMLEWELGGPEALVGINPLMHWFEAHNRSHSINLLPELVLHDVSLKAMMKGVKRHSERLIVHSIEAAIEKVCELQPGFDAQEMRRTIYAEQA